MSGSAQVGPAACYRGNDTELDLGNARFAAASEGEVLAALVQLKTELHFDTKAHGLQALFYPRNGKRESSGQLCGSGAAFVFGIEAERQVIVVEDGDTLGHIP